MVSDLKTHVIASELSADANNANDCEEPHQDPLPPNAFQSVCQDLVRWPWTDPTSGHPGQRTTLYITVCIIHQRTVDGQDY